jgi:hypothetical protein
MTNPGSMQLLVRTLKGAPLSCLMVLALADGPVEVGRLSMLTGYSPHPVTEALKMLAEIGLARSGKQRSDWQITPNALQVFAALQASESTAPVAEIRENRDSESVVSTTATAVNQSPDINLTAVVAALNTAISEMGLEPSAGALRGDSLDRHELPPGMVKQRSRKKRPGQHRDRPSGPSGRIGEDTVQVSPEILKALHQAGIFEPTARELACLPHVTLQYVQAHAAKARREQIGTGLLIHRIRSRDPLPEDPDNRNRYISGEYAEFIKH